MGITDFSLSPRARARKYSIGFLIKTLIECQENFRWMKFHLKKDMIIGKGSLLSGKNSYDFYLEYSPFFKFRMDKIVVTNKEVKKLFATHFNADGTLCLYHPIKDLNGDGFIELLDIMPWISEWVYFYEKYLQYNVWLGPEHPHNF